MPSEIGRLIALQRHPLGNLVPRTVHDAFWQMHSEQQDYLVLYSYGSDRCGITLVREHTLRGRIRQAFCRQDRSIVEDAFTARSASLLTKPNPGPQTTQSQISQKSFILATQLSLFIDCRLSGNASDLKLQESMLRKINESVDADIVSNAWRFCVYNVLCPWYRVPLFSQSQPTLLRGNYIPSLALRDNPRHGWKYVLDYLQQVIEMSEQQSNQPFVKKNSASSPPSPDEYVQAFKRVRDIASVLYLLTTLFQRAPPLLVASGVKRSFSGKAAKPSLCPNTVEEFLQHYDDKAHHILLDDVLEKSNFNAHMDQELQHNLQQFCPDYFKERQFLKVIRSVVVGDSTLGTSLDSSFRKVKKMNSKSLANQADCDAFQKQITKLMSDHESVLTKGDIDWSRIKSDMHFCALLLGFTSDDYQPPRDMPEFWQLGSDNMSKQTSTDSIWERCFLKKPAVAGGNILSFPFLFQPPVKYICLQLCRVHNLMSQRRAFKDDQLKNDTPTKPDMKVSDLYQNTLQQLLLMAYNQKTSLSTTSAAVGAKLFQDAVEAALSMNHKVCTKMYVYHFAWLLNILFILMFLISVCDWLDVNWLDNKNPNKGGFTPLHILHTYPDTEPFFSVIATRSISLISFSPEFCCSEICPTCN
jgi:hypothetical protein